MKKVAVLALVFLFGLSLSAVYAQTMTGSSTGKQTAQSQSKAQLDKSDRDFLTQAAHGGMAEVELGKVAASKGPDEQVRQMGQKLVNDHTKANEQLMSVAQSKGVTLPSGLDKADQNKIDKLSKLSGKEFDKAFWKEVEKDHNKDIALFKKEAKSGKDPELKSFASQMIPALEGHLKMAKEMSTGSHSASARK